MRILPALLALGASLTGTLVSQAPVRATVGGVVRDSLAPGVLRGATVQLVAADDPARFGRTVVSDSEGRFEFVDVPDGRYTLGFYHAKLDSIGIEPMLRAVAVEGQRTVQVDLAIPAPARLRAAVCGATAAANGGAIVGFVRDARARAPLVGARVTAEWLEVSVGREGMTRRTGRRDATAGEGGWFALCNVPRPGTVLLRAHRGGDSTELVAAEVPDDGFLRRELFVGSARTLVVTDTLRGSKGDSLVARRVTLGDGRVSGSVMRAENGLPLAGATVSIVNGPQTRANARGEFTLVDAPTGSRVIEVRAVGYYPERRAIDVVDGSAPLRVSLPTLRSVLDTFKVTANKAVYDNFRGFEMRRKSGLGRFLTAGEIERHIPQYTQDIFRFVQGVFITDDTIQMRGVIDARCSPSIFVNGQDVSSFQGRDLDMAVRPREIIGIEVYAVGQVPAQFDLGMTGCGAIVIWRR